jgi:hypothetical protein
MAKKLIGTGPTPITSGSKLFRSLADKIYEEDNEIYSSTQHNEEESNRDPNEKSQDNLQFGTINNTQLLIRKKDPSFLETLYNHRAKIDNDRVTNARRRLEEKYSTNKWKINNELMNTAFRKANFNKTQKLTNDPKQVMASSGAGFYQHSTPPSFNSGRFDLKKANHSIK